MKEKISHLALISVGILSTAILLFCFIEYVFPVLLPFIIAWIVASVTVGPAKRLSAKIKTPEKIIRLVISVLFTLIFIATGMLVIWRTTTSLWQFLVDISEQNQLYDLLSRVLSKDVPFFGELLPPELATRISDAFGSLISSGMSFIAEWVTALAGGVPRLFLFLLVTLISLVYFSLDYDKISAFVKSYLPKNLSELLSRLRSSIVLVLKKYVLSYSLILMITYATLLVGLLLLGVEHAAVVAFFIALLDVLPIIGVGTVLIPWSIYELAIGDSALGIGLILLFLANAVIRQISEPKIVGKSLDLHPIITLITLYVGYALFGLWGMLLLPVAAVCISTALKGDNAAKVT